MNKILVQENTKTDVSHLHTFAVLAYKENPYIEETLLSLINQRIQSKIIICTSTPNLYLTELAKKYEFPIHINTSEKKGSIAHDSNFAFSQVQTPYVTLAHQDDVYHTEYTAKMLPELLKNENALIAFCDAYEIQTNGVKKAWSVNMLVKRILLFFFYLKKVWSNEWIKRTSIMFGSAIMCPSVMFNLQKLNNFQFETSYQCNLDWDAWYRISQLSGSFIYIKEKCFSFRLSDTQHTSQYLASGIRQKEDALMFERMWWKPIANILKKLYALNYGHYSK